MTKIWKSLVGENIREIRTAKSWTQKDLATAAGCSRATIAAIELGYEKDPSATMLINIARALDTTAEALLSIQSENTKKVRSPSDLLSDLKALFDSLPLRIPIVNEEQMEIGHAYWTKSKVAEATGADNIVAMMVGGSTLMPQACRGDVLFADREVLPADGDLLICENRTTERLAPCRYREGRGGGGRIESPDQTSRTDDWLIIGVVMEVERKLRDYANATSRTQSETAWNKYADTFTEYQNELVEHVANVVRGYTGETKGKEFEEKLRKSLKPSQKTMKKFADALKIFQK